MIIKLLSTSHFTFATVKMKFDMTYFLFERLCWYKFKILFFTWRYEKQQCDS